MLVGVGLAAWPPPVVNPSTAITIANITAADFAVFITFLPLAVLNTHYFSNVPARLRSLRDDFAQLSAAEAKLRFQHCRDNLPEIGSESQVSSFVELIP